MADPFSIIAGTASLVDICVRVVNYLRDVQKAAATIEDDITSLIHEIEALDALGNSIKHTVDEKYSSSPANAQRDKNQDLWKHINRTIQDCRSVAEKLEVIVKDVYGKSGPSVSGLRDALAKSHRRRGKEGELRQCRDQLATYQNVLQILLSFVNFQEMQGSQEANARSFDRVTQDLRAVDHRLGTQIAALQDSIDASVAQPPQYVGSLSALQGLRNSIDYAAGTLKLLSGNKYFDVPQPVSSIYTGREVALEELKELFVTSPGHSHQLQQKRFVVYGIGGAGKTQFCSKFAEDNRDRFWGVFWIDASSIERIKQTYAQIAKVAKVEPNENAAMHWLSNLEEHWLLLIDNADDPKVEVERYFPRGNRGHILITTRNPALKVHGNIGPGFYEFHGLGFHDANDLLLKAARIPTPWDSTSEHSASTITKSLGFLVLAIVHAGAVIRDGLCTLKTYLSFYDRSWTRLRQARIDSEAQVEDSTHHMYVYTTWEICYARIETKAKAGSEAAQDALQLLSVFSFMHREYVPYDMFLRCVQTGIIESEYESNEAKKAQMKRKKEPESLAQTFERFKIAALTFVSKNRGPAPLPSVIRDARRSGIVEEYDDRLRYALKELVQMSLVTHNEAIDAYSMHPIVHKWARERPGMRLAEQALWSEAAANILCSSILLPPLRNNANDEDYARNILPHVDHVRKCRRIVRERLDRKLQKRWISFFVPQSHMNRDRALMYAKFSLVYAYCGYWTDAALLQVEVRDFLTKMLGPDNERTRRITIALSLTYLNLGRGTEAEQLQRDILNSCLTKLGPDHLDTLRAKDMLGQTLWQRGRFSEARELHEEAFHGLGRRLGNDHEDTLNAMDNLARTIGRFWEKEDFKQAYALHLEAIRGMEKIHGVDHPRTLIAKSHLARFSVDQGDDLAEFADTLIAEVIEGMRRKLGKEHPYTLLAMANAAIIKTALGQLDEAEALVMVGLPIAERNLGKDHIGTLFGYFTLAAVRIEQGRHREAEEMLVDVTERQKAMLSHRGDYHPDRLGALIELAKSYRLQNKISESIRVCDEALKGFEEISTREHPLARSMKEARKRMVEHQQSLARGESGDPDIAKPNQGQYRQYSLF